VTWSGELLIARFQVPKYDQPILTGGSQYRASRRKGNLENRAAVTGKSFPFLARG
jgi:hypothetical protein